MIQPITLLLPSGIHSADSLLLELQERVKKLVEIYSLSPNGEVSGLLKVAQGLAVARVTLNDLSQNG